MIKAVIFDLDGVLVDATEWHYEALNKALNLFGIEIGKEEHLKVYNGLPTNEKLKILSERGELPFGIHEIIKIMKKKYTDEIVALNCTPSYEKLIMLACLKKKGLKLACCSNAQKYSVENMLKRSMLDQYFDEIVGNDEGYRSKPEPDIYLETFRRLQIEPNEAVIVEDAPHGIAAARSSGAKVIEVRGYQEVNLLLFERNSIITL